MTSPVTAPAASRSDIGLLVLRVALGIIFVAHGGQKIFVMGLAGTAGMFARMGIPLPSLMGRAIALLEFGGGLALIFGILTPIVALALALDTLGAVVMVKAKGGFFAPRGAEFELILCAASLALGLTGGGSLSLDRILRARRG
ncbi:MAG: DoxX family protein [Gemmatimonadota bacterium]|nr:DoxX family protein [Gemmatimonadota bacterium]